MNCEIIREVHLEQGAFVTYTIKGQKNPIVELYNLDGGYLVLYSSPFYHGYFRAFYKANRSAHERAKKEAVKYCKYFWDNVTISYI